MVFLDNWFNQYRPFHFQMNRRYRNLRPIRIRPMVNCADSCLGEPSINSFKAVFSTLVIVGHHVSIPIACYLGAKITHDRPPQ